MPTISQCSFSFLKASSAWARCETSQIKLPPLSKDRGETEISSETKNKSDHADEMT